MFCIRSDVITLKYIEMYGFVTGWTSMDNGPGWVILLVYGSHDMRHTGFHRLTVVNETPGVLGRHSFELLNHSAIKPPLNHSNHRLNR